MSLETLQRRWDEFDQKLDERLRRQDGFLRRLYLQSVQAPLRRRSWAVGAEVALNVAVLLLLGSFLFHHLAALPFLLPGLGLYLFALWQLVASVRQLVALRTLDYSSPLVALQQRLARLRVQSLTQLLWTVALSPLLWPLLVIVGLKGLLGLDAYAVLGLPWLGVNLLLGLVFVPLAVGLARLLGRRFESSPKFQRLLGDLAGRSLLEAREALEVVEAFAGSPEAVER
ncbi:MAG: hypothetical protein OHK0015_53080 [Chloroflexi bacterium OHK40]